MYNHACHLDFRHLDFRNLDTVGYQIANLGAHPEHELGVFY